MARRPRTLTACAAATAVAALTLSACGGGDDTSSGKIKGAHKDDNSGPSASPSATSGPKRPEVKLPKSFQMDFQDWTDSDPEKQAVLNDGRESHRATFAAVIDNNPSSEALQFYGTKIGYGQSKHWAKGYTDDDLTVLGKASMFNPKVDVKDHKVATLSFCSDEGDGYTKNRKTGKKVRTPNDEAEVHYFLTLHKSQQGVWETNNVTSSNGCS